MSEHGGAFPTASEAEAGDGDRSLLRTILSECEPEHRGEIVRAYLCDELARILRMPDGELDPEVPVGHLGVDSLMALELRNRTFADLGVHIPMAHFARNPTVSELADAASAPDAATSTADAADAATLVRIVPSPDDRHLPFPLSDIQEAYWLGRSGQFALGDVSTHVYVEVDAIGLDRERLEHAIRRTIERHDMLRAIVLSESSQRILPQVPPYTIATSDLRGQDALTISTHLENLRQHMANQVLPADRWPLFDIRASVLDERTTRLHISLDLLIADAFSWQLGLRDVALFYESPDAPLEPLQVSFRDYMITQKAAEDSEAYRRARAYWRERLPELPPAPELPLARNPHEVLRPRFARRTERLDSATWSRLEQRAVRAGLTPSGVLLAAFAELLALFARKPRFTLNLTLLNRLALHPDLDRIMGDFTSTVLVAAECHPAATFEVQARKLQEQLWTDLEHRSTSGVQVLRELAHLRGGRQAMMPVVFTSLLGIVGSEIQAPRGVEFQTVYGISQTPQVWLDHQVWEHQGELVFQWDVVEELFPDGLVQEMFEVYTSLLRHLAGDETSWQSPAQSWLRKRVQTAQRTNVNATSAPIPDETLDSLFRARVSEQRHAQAVIAAGRTLTYEELHHRAAGLSEKLLRLGARPNTLIAVAMEKGWEQIVGVLGVLGAGAAYLPLDPALPAERLGHLLERGEVRVVLTQSWLESSVPWPTFVERIHVDREEPGPTAAAAPRSRPEDLAYVIYTSGSTGEPKGVMIDHRGAVNTILDVNARFAVGPGDRILALSSLGFDLSVYDVFGALAAGAAIVVPEASSARDPSAWAKCITENQVTIWNSVPALMHMFVDHAEGRGDVNADSLRLALMSGDWIPVALPARIASLAPKIRVVSLGGATEASIWSIAHPIAEVAPHWTSIPYGLPMANQRWYVLDDALEPLPPWVTGHLHIAGTGLALGYWRDEERTRERFVVHPATGERLYRTGDLGRQRVDGVFEILGREDHQVKIRGHRIELGEIEAAISQHGSVRAAVVVADGPSREHLRLVAHVVLDDESALGSLDPFVRAKLPSYMVPAEYVRRDALPLSANGKIDREALLTRRVRTTEADMPLEAPRTPMETALARAFAGVLNLHEQPDAPPIGRETNFFALGGDSLLATRLVAHLRKDLGLDADVRSVFESPTVAALATALEKLATRGDRAAPIVPMARDIELPLSFGQSRLWFLAQLAPESPLYNIAHVLRLQGDLARDALAHALDELVRRHEILRTTFAESEDGSPVQRISPAAKLDLPQIDLTHVPDDVREREAASRLRLDAERPFDLGKGPLVRVTLVRLAPREHLLSVVMHHIVTDGWSYSVFARELGHAYAAFAKGQPSPLADLPIQYADFAHWQRNRISGARLDRLLAHWKDRLADAPDLDLPTDHTPDERTFAAQSQAVILGLPLTRALQALAGREGVTLFMVLLAGLNALLSRYTGQDDIVVGTVIAGRDRTELEPLLGFFVNQLVLRTDLSGDPTVHELLRRVSTVSTDAYLHQELPFEILVQNVAAQGASTRAPLFRTRLVLQNTPPASIDLPGLDVRITPTEIGVAEVDLSVELFETDQGLVGRLVCDRELFEESTARRMVDHFTTLLRGMVDAPTCRVSALPLLSADEMQRILAENDTPRRWPGDGACLPARFEAQVARTPTAIALEFEGEAISYEELDRRANRLARFLQYRGIERGDVVGSCAERSPDMVTAFLAILKAGAAYMPLDPEHPAERRDAMLADTKAKAVVGAERFLSDLGWSGTRIALERDRSAILAQSPTALASTVQPEDLAYVIHTSGSTGRPKGVLLHHGGLQNVALATIETFAIEPRSRVLQTGSPSFDLSVGEMASTLLAGATLCLARAEELLPGPQFVDMLRERAISVVALPPSALSVMIPGSLPSLRTVASIGEALPDHVVDRWQPGRTMINGYGPTETTVYASFARCVAGEGRAPIGRPLPNVELHVLDRTGQRVPTGVTGELFIGGIGVAKGYVDPDLTAERFVPDPFRAVQGALLYRTGDRVRRRTDGQLDFIGRADEQIKVRGFRVEPGEVESILRQHPEVDTAVVVARGEGSERQLVAYVVPAMANQEDLATSLRPYCRERLPSHMVPAAITTIARLPYLSNGKLDRRALAAVAPQSVDRPVTSPRSPTERTLATIWGEVLRVASISVDDDFFDLGGHSLLATQAASKMRAAFDIELPVRTLFEARTLEALSARIDLLQMRPASTLDPLGDREEGSI